MISYQSLLTAALLVGLSYPQSRAPGVVDAFQGHVVVARHSLLPPSAATSCSALEMAAKGMGGGMMAKKKKKAKGPTAAAAKKGLQKNKNGKTQSQPFNVNASLLRLEKNYDDLTRAAAKNLMKERYEDDDDDIVTTEYVVAARAHGYVSDWVPVAQICLARPASLVHAGDGGVSDPLVRAAVSCYCRELSLVASLGARVFQSVPRNLLQYAVETSDSFHKHVISAVEDDPRESSKSGSSRKQDGEPSSTKMTKQEARQVLQLPDGTSTTDDKSEIKQAYRKLSFQFHPDRFARGAAAAAATAERSQAQVQESADQYTRIQLAYETLTSGLRGASSSLSWYESLGGRARSTDFLGPIELWPLATAQDILQQQKEAALVESAVVGLDPDLVQGFVTRANSQQS